MSVRYVLRWSDESSTAWLVVTRLKIWHKQPTSTDAQLSGGDTLPWHACDTKLAHYYWWKMLTEWLLQQSCTAIRVLIGESARSEKFLVMRLTCTHRLLCTCMRPHVDNGIQYFHSGKLHRAPLKLNLELLRSRDCNRLYNGRVE